MEIKRIDQIIDKHEAKASALVQVLLEIQSENHWLPKEALERVAQRLQVPLSRIQHIVTFYKAFSLVPKGRHEIHVCMGTACHVQGGEILSEEIQKIIGIRPGEISEDHKFEFHEVACLGCCAQAPVVEIDGRVYGKMTRAKLQKVLAAYESI